MNKIYILPKTVDHYSFVKQLASQKHNIPINTLEIGRNEHGKPYFKALSDFHFNISHSGELLAIAVSLSPVGIDIEEKRIFNKKIIKRFHPKEIEYINSENSENRFFEVWTKKEACLKYNGIGLSGGLDSFSIFEFSPLPISYTFGEYFISVCGHKEFELIIKV